MDWDVFISYAHSDLEAVIPISDALRAAGVAVWRDEDEIESFDAITRSVRDGVSKSRVLLAYYSERYPTRRACQWELTAAFLAAQRLGDPRNRILVINPELTGSGAFKTAHIEPVQLRDAVFEHAPHAGDQQAVGRLVEQVTRRLSAIQGALGLAGSLLSRSLGLRPISSPSFAGRIPELWGLHSALTAGEAVQITGATEGGVVLVSGVGGVGKSLLAEEYVLRYAAAWPGGVFWLSASESEPMVAADTLASESSLNSQLRTIAAQLQIDIAGRSADEIAGDLRSYLERVEGQCLWVVDDLPPGLAAECARAWFAPDARATTLITARTREYALLAREVELSGLSAPDGYILLTAGRSPHGAEEADAAHRIVADLAGHGLALAIAGAELRTEAGVRSFADYRDVLNHPTTDALALAAELAQTLPTGHEPNVATTLLRSIERIADRGQDLLRVAATLAVAPIPTQLFVLTFARVDGLDPPEALARAAQAVSSTDRYCLTEVPDAAGETRLVHPLVTRTIRFHDENTDRADALQAAVGSALYELISVSLGVGATDPGSEVLIAHARALLQSAGPVSMLGTIADAVTRYDYIRGNYLAAAAAQQQILAYRQAILGPDHVSTLTAARQLASTLHGLGDLSHARTLQEEVLATSQRVFGEGHPETVIAMNNLAATLSDAGDPEARDLQERAIDSARRVVGEDHPDTLTALGNLAGILRDRGELDAARELDERVLEARRRLLGDDHPATLLGMNNLAGTLKLQGDNGAARDLQEKVVEARRRVLGDLHPDTLVAVGNLARTLRDEGDLDRSVLLQEESVQGTRSVLGDDNPRTITVLTELASTLKERRELTRAHELGELAVEISRRVFGDEHRETLRALNNFAQTIWEEGDLETARARHEEIVETVRRNYGDDDPLTLAAMNNLAVGLMSSGDAAAAKDIQEKVVEAWRRRVGNSHPDTRSAMTNLATILRGQGDFAGARHLQEEILETTLRDLGEDSPETLTAMTNLASTEFAQGDSEGARELQQRVVQGRRRALGFTHPDTIEAEQNLRGIDERAAEGPDLA